MPSTPTEYLMCNGSNHVNEAVYNISPSAPAARSLRYIITNATAQTTKALAPTTITPLIALMPFESQSPKSISRGINTNNDKKFISNVRFYQD